MASYQYGTSPRKVETEQKQRTKKQKHKKTKIKLVEELPRQQVKISKEQKKKHIKLTILALTVFAVLLAISYQNSQITVKFNEMQDKKKELATLQKENEHLLEQLELASETNLNNSTDDAASVGSDNAMFGRSCVSRVAELQRGLCTVAAVHREAYVRRTRSAV